ncbi:ribonuclease H-like domain-containing protein [Bacillus suaedaesalsae]|uniref:Ribonuclease H-like domain-containing protein n=1 Tax=Bacillus suaedaesalsae TaxID=2810349 RepID=A0ABS2DLG6_9BACI|nr:ribonuclease H-like domain-containing protein [Bacillus suaedaesalsae]MBM6619293.1 ribonuclease H-like domain-containing protein [Bacillus suaedaesalsae]
MSLKSKLNRMKKHLVSEDMKAEQKVEKNISTPSIPFLDDWKAFDAKPYFFENEYIFIREKVYPLTTMHGLYELGALNDTVKKWNCTSLEHPLSITGLSASDLFFFDTETTGLGGGTGNTIFLLGYARVYEDRIVVKQLFLPGPSSEVALYHYFLSDVDYNTLVTFNGKAFDWPQVKTRHTLIRDHVPKLPQFGHFDLLHASRRLWKTEYESLKLSVVEKEILNIHRTSDTPGFMAPMIYFHYLEDENPEGVFEIMKHNETDILTLISLYVHISNKVLDFGGKNTNTEQYEVARWFDSIGNREVAKKNYENLLQKTDSNAWETKSNLAALYKKEQNMKQAVVLWDELVSEAAPYKIRLHAAVELAKFFEHKKKDIQRAIHYTMKAKEVWEKEIKVKVQYVEKWEIELEKRYNRLQRKVRKIL